MKELANVSARQVEVRMQKLLHEIKSSYHQAHTAALEVVRYALICGRFLNEAKRLSGHGNFSRFLVENSLSPNTAQRYMRLAEHFHDLQEKLGEDDVHKMTLQDLDDFIRKNCTKKRGLSTAKPAAITQEYAEVEDVDDEPADEGYDDRGAEIRLGDIQGDAGDCEGGLERRGDPYDGEVARGNYDNDPGGDQGSGDIRQLDCYQSCLRLQRHIDERQRLLDDHHQLFPDDLLYARICGREDENSRDLARWSKAGD